MTLREDQVQRYGRQILLREVGGKGQEKLLNATVAVRGEGASLDEAITYLAAGGSPLDADYGVEDREWAGLLGRDGHLDRLPTERGAYPEFYRILAEKIIDGGTSSALPLPVDPAGPVEVLRLIEQARELATQRA